jgi:hypothetical protein
MKYNLWQYSGIFKILPENIKLPMIGRFEMKLKDTGHLADMSIKRLKLIIQQHETGIYFNTVNHTGYKMTTKEFQLYIEKKKKENAEPHKRKLRKILKDYPEYGL